jgi:ABC-2 type transport system permease protein
MIAAQTRAELVMSLRRGESLLVTFGIPLMLLVFLAKVDVLPIEGSSRIAFLVPGIVALAVMSTAMVSMGISTGFERHYGVLKRLGATPLTRPALITAKSLTVLAILLLQVIVILGVSAALGWDPSGRVIVAAAVVVLGTIAFTGLGLLLAGSLRGEANLAAANGLYLLLLFLGGMAFPLTRLPGAVQAIAKALPASALADCLRATLSAGGTVPARGLLVLALWAVAAPAAAALTFRWE